MTIPPCNCAHVETLVVLVRGDKEPMKQRSCRFGFGSFAPCVQTTIVSTRAQLQGGGVMSILPVRRGLHDSVFALPCSAFHRCTTPCLLPL